MTARDLRNVVLLACGIVLLAGCSVSPESTASLGSSTSVATPPTPNPPVATAPTPNPPVATPPTTNPPGVYVTISPPAWLLAPPVATAPTPNPPVATPPTTN